MKHLAVGLLMIFGLNATMAKPLPFEELTNKGRAIPFYGEIKNEQLSGLPEALKKNKIAEQMASVVNNGLRIKKDIGVGFLSCETPNAYFQPNKSRIVVCYELLDLFAKYAKQDKELQEYSEGSNIGKFAMGAMWGVYMHELGHALISINGVPITGREEDVADQFALYVAARYFEPNNLSIVLPTIWFFKTASNNNRIADKSIEVLKRSLADTHSLDEQRVFNFACWAYGANPQTGLEAARYAQLPASRAQRCPSEYAQLAGGFQSQFKRYFKNK